MIKAARDLVVGKGPCLPPSEQWDRDFLGSFLNHRLEDFDTMTDAEIDRIAGFGAHEVRTWVAAAAAAQEWAICAPSFATITWCRNGSPGWASWSDRAEPRRMIEKIDIRHQLRHLRRRLPADVIHMEAVPVAPEVAGLTRTKLLPVIKFREHCITCFSCEIFCPEQIVDVHPSVKNRPRPW